MLMSEPILEVIVFHMQGKFLVGRHQMITKPRKGTTGSDWRRYTIGSVIAIVIASWSLPALAIDDSSRAAARTLVNEGAEYFKQGRYVEARRKFLDAYEVAKVPTVAVWAAQANEKLGKLIAAAELYEAALLMQPDELWIGNAQQQAQEQALQALRLVKPRIATLKINLLGATASEVEVTIDNAKMPSALLVAARPTDPGTHVVTVTRGGKVVVETVIALAAAEKKVVEVQVPAADGAAAPMAAPAVPAPATTQTPGVGPAATPVTTNANAMQPAAYPPSQLAPQTAGTLSPGGASPESSSVSTRRTIGWVGIGVGIAGVTLGVTGGIIAGITRSQLNNDGCRNNVCVGSRFDSAVNGYNSWRTVSTAGFIVGGVCAAAGVTLLLTSPRQESAPRVGLMMGPGALGLKGAF
jgi:hypothetical protein